MGGGGGSASGGAYFSAGTVGQASAGATTGGSYWLGGGFWSGGGTPIVGVGDPGLLAFRLDGPSPNPLVGASIVSFVLPESRDVRIGVYDLAGRRTRTLAHDRLEPGRHQREWDGRDDDGRAVRAGVYFLQFEAGPTHLRRTLTVLR